MNKCALGVARTSFLKDFNSLGDAKAKREAKQQFKKVESLEIAKIKQKLSISFNNIRVGAIKQDAGGGISLFNHMQRHPCSMPL